VDIKTEKELRQQIASRVTSDDKPGHFHEVIERVAEGVGALDTLGIDALLNAWSYLTELKTRIESGHLHGLLHIGAWFVKLSDEQRSQIIDYYNTQLEEYGLVLIWFSRGHQSGYKFEPLKSPVASR
jgi:hypothetical protein